jgi:hypothetical protein
VFLGRFYYAEANVCLTEESRSGGLIWAYFGCSLRLLVQPHFLAYSLKKTSF